MSLENRINEFQTSVVAKKLLNAKGTFYRATFLRLWLVRRTAEFLLSSVILFGGHQLVILNTYFSPVWPASGVALSALFLRGRSMLVSIFIATLISYLYNKYSVVLSLQQAFLFTGFILVVREGALKWIGAVTPIATLSVFLKFMIFTAILTALHISLMAKLFTQHFDTSISLYGWLFAWLGELNGILCLTPLCLVADPFMIQHYFNKKVWRWWMCSLILIICHGLFFILPNPTFLILLSIVLCLSLCVFAALFGQIPICNTVFGVSIVYLAGVLPDAHLFQTATTSQESVLLFALLTLATILSLGIGTFLPRGFFTRSNKLRNDSH